MTSADLRYYLYVFLRRLHVFIAIAAGLTALGVGLALMLPPVYRATSTILVETPQIPTELARSTAPGNPLARMQVIHQQLKTREALLSLAHRHAIYGDEDELSVAEMVDELRARIGLEPVFFGGDQGALGFAVSFDDGDPQRAARVVNDIVATILERDAASRSSRASTTLSFFEGEVNRLAISVRDVEARLQAYKSEHQQALPDSLEFRRAQHMNLQDRLLILEREKAMLGSRRASYVQLYETTGQVAENAVQTPQQQMLSELHAALAEQRARFSADSPAIAALESRIAAAEAAFADTGDGAAGRPETPQAPSVLDIQLAEIDDRLAAIELERTTIERQAEELVKSIAATPANEAVLRALEREHANKQTLYNAAVSRFGEAATGEQIESRFKGERLSLMEAALPPERPVRSKRLLIAAGGAGAGVLGGLALVLGLEYFGGRIRRPAELQRALGIDPIASIPYMPVPDRRRRRLLRLPRFVVTALDRVGVIAS